MGKAVTKTVTDFPVKKVAEAIQETATAAATHTKRKMQKEGQQFMAAQRMEKLMDKQKEVPRRAPMNLRKMDIPEEMRAEKLKEAELSQQEDTEYLSLMKNVFVTSRDSERSISNKEVEKQGPTNTSSNLNDSTKGEVPKGRSSIKDIIAALYNNQMDPNAWGPAEIANKINIRETDAKHILENFELFNNTSIISSKHKTVSNSEQTQISE